MSADHAVFLRGISNVSMGPFCERLEGLGFACVRSFGMSGNFVFCADNPSTSELERSIGEALGAEAFVRTRSELAAIVAADPNAGRDGAAVFLGKRAIDPSRATALLSAGFLGDPPVVLGAQVYFTATTRRVGRKGMVDFERELDVRGTMRSSKVLARVLQLMPGDDRR